MENKNYLYNNYLNMARNLRTENNILKSLTFYQKAYAMNIGKQDIELLMDMALIYDEIGFLDEAERKYLEIIELDEDEARAYYGLAIIYDENDELEKAKEYYEKAIEKNPNYDKAYFFLANIYDEFGEKDNAIINYKKAIEINPNDLWTYANLSCILEEMNRNEDALHYINKALEVDNRNYKVLFNKAVILNKLNRTAESKEYYIKSIQERDFKKAIEVISQGIEHNENQGFLYYNRGCFYVNLNENMKAFNDIIKSIELDDLFFDYMKKDRELDPVRELEEYKKFICKREYKE